jgi:hypothetical protein
MVVNKLNTYTISEQGFRYSFTKETNKETFQTSLYPIYSEDWFKLQQQCRDVVKTKIMEDSQCN